MGMGGGRSKITGSALKLNLQDQKINLFEKKNLFLEHNYLVHPNCDLKVSQKRLFLKQSKKIWLDQPANFFGYGN